MCWCACVVLVTPRILFLLLLLFVCLFGNPQVLHESCDASNVTIQTLQRLAAAAAAAPRNGSAFAGPLIYECHFNSGSVNNSVVRERSMPPPPIAEMNANANARPRGRVDEETLGMQHTPAHHACSRACIIRDVIVTRRRFSSEQGRTTSGGSAGGTTSTSTSTSTRVNSRMRACCARRVRHAPRAQRQQARITSRT